MAVKHLEVEQKYDADADFVLPDLDGLPAVASIGEPERHQLAATYFDTPDLRLAAHGITLRRRRGGPDAGWHLKMPVGPDSRQELQAPLGRATVVPAKLAGLVSAYTRGAPLRTVASLDTERTVVRLLDAAGAVLAEVADDLVTGRDLHKVETDGEKEAAPTERWREIEVELAAGTPDLLKAAGKQLRKAGARRGSSSSKLGRLLHEAIAPVTAAEARTTARARIVEATSNGKGPAPTVGETVLAYLATQVEAVIHYDPRTRLGEEDAVHQMRVAVRRIRSALRSYRPVLDTERTEPLTPELKWLAAELGEVRDLEVLRMRFSERLHALEGSLEGGTTPALLDDLARRERGAYRRLNAALKEPRYYELLDALEKLITDPPLSETAGRKARKELPVLVRRSWSKLARAYTSISTSDDPETARHDTRKAAKRARYAADLALPVLGAAAKQVSQDAKRLQDVLGGYQDGVIAMEHLQAAAARARTTPDAFTLGVLYGIEHGEAAEARGRLAATWSQTLGPSF